MTLSGPKVQGPRERSMKNEDWGASGEASWRILNLIWALKDGMDLEMCQGDGRKFLEGRKYLKQRCGK